MVLISVYGDLHVIGFLVRQTQKSLGLSCHTKLVVMGLIMSTGRRTFSKVNSPEDRAVLTIEEIQNVVGEKVGEDLDCVDWHFSTENFKDFCPLGCRPVSGGEDAEIKVASTVSSETAKVLQKWMDLNDSCASSRASGTLCVRHSSGKLKYRLSLKHILPLSVSFENRRDDTRKVDVFMNLSCASFYLEERHESSTPLFVSDYPHSVLYRLAYRDHFTNKVIYEVFTSLEDAEFRCDEVSDIRASVSELCISSYDLE